MIKHIKTSLAFTKNIFTTGAFKETSKDVEREICTRLSKEPGQIVVEFGLGHGNITKEILKNLSPDAKVYAFEVNKSFCDYVGKMIKDDRLVIVHGGAESFADIVKGPVNNFISSLPLTLFPKELSNQILHKSYDALEVGGFFSQIQYSKVHYKKFQEVFDGVDVTRFVNIPMEYVFHCGKA